VLFERFISKERNEPPDIDVDFEHQRREEVIQYIYAKYGRERAALAAAVISYRTRSALRDAGRALGIRWRRSTRLAKEHYWFDGSEERPQRCADAGLDPGRPAPACSGWLAADADRLSAPPEPARGRLRAHPGAAHRLVPVENAAMAERTVIQWDKDDLDAVGLLKVDVLALGMLSAIRRCLANWWAGAAAPPSLQDIPAEDTRHLRHDLRAPTPWACSRSKAARR
jgi:error-prone DNA polymerase